MAQRAAGRSEASEAVGVSRYEAAEAALARYALPAASVVPLKDGQASTFLVRSPRKGQFLLRLYSSTPSERGERSARGAAIHSIRTMEGVRSQALWLSYLRRTARLPVPEPIPTSSGELVGSLPAESTADHGFSLLLRWIPGEQKEIADLTRRDTYFIGRYMAKLHLHAERFVPPNGFFRPRWDWRYMFDENANYWRIAKALMSGEEVDILHSAGERIREELHAIGEPREQFGLIHRDLHPANLVFHEGVVYAIDFDHCGWGYYLYDLALLYLDFECLGERCEQMREALLEGYQSCRPLPDDHRATLETFVHMHVMNRFIRLLGRLWPSYRDKGDFRLGQSPQALQSRVRRLEEFSSGVTGISGLNG